jgi:pSer/pThr/pTyr-binding forkhead associated (FHA) protein
MPYNPEEQDTNDIEDDGDEVTKDFENEEQEYADLWLEYSEHGSSATSRLKRHITMIGRRPGTDVQLKNLLVTREHAKITISHNAIQITDLGSKHGVFIQNHAPKSSDHRIPVRQDVPIEINECFWIGRDIKAVIRPDSGDETVRIDT